MIRPGAGISDYRGYAGQLASGALRRGDEVAVLPGGARTRIAAIDTYDGELEEAMAPMSLTLRLEDEIDVSRGELICHPDRAPVVGREFVADICWMTDEPMRPGARYLIKHTSRSATAAIDGIEDLLDVHTLERTDPPAGLALNDIGRVRLRTSTPLAFDPYTEHPPHRQLHPHPRVQQRDRRRRDDRLRPRLSDPSCACSTLCDVSPPGGSDSNGVESTPAPAKGVNGCAMKGASMGHARLVICALLAAVLAGAAGASAASAATLYITKSGNDTNACTSPSAPCLTISAAIAKSELLDETSTLDIGPGTYEETVELGGTADGGLILDGAGAGAGGTEILAPAAATHPAIGVDVPEANLTIENLSVVSPKGESQPGIESGADLTLDNVNVTMTEDSGEAGIVSEEIGSLTMNGGGVTMTGANDASAVSTFGTSLSMNGATLTLSKDVSGDAIQGVDAPVSVSNTTVNITESEGTSGIGAGLVRSR